MSDTPGRPRAAKIAAVLVVVAALAVAWRAGVFARAADPASLARELVEMGAWGYLAFLVAFTTLQPFGAPGTAFVVAAALIWPWPTAYALSMTGVMCSSVVGFSFSRFVARDWVSARIPARFRRYSDALEAKAFRTVVLLRMVFLSPQPLHAFFGVSKVPFWTHFWGSLVGYAPPLLVMSYLSSSIFDVSGKLQPGAWRILGAMAALGLTITGALWVRDRRKHAPAR